VVAFKTSEQESSSNSSFEQYGYLEERDKVDYEYSYL